MDIRLYYCHLTLHDNVFFASREMGILYETEKYLHNWALSYALFEVEYIPKPYRMQGKTAQRPGYLDSGHEQNLLLLNEVGLYVFPALPLKWSYQINTFKAAQVTYYGKSKQFGDKGADRNYPINYGRAKEIAANSTYQTFILASPQVELPERKWIRLGKWAAKIEVKITRIPDDWIRQRSNTASDSYCCRHPLNPLDLPPSTQLLLYNRVVMPPASLVSQAQLTGGYWHIAKPENRTKKKQRQDPDPIPNCPKQVSLPLGVAYGANALAAAS